MQKVILPLDAGSAVVPAPDPANPNPSLKPAAIGNPNITALLGVLVKKELAPAEANAIRNAPRMPNFGCWLRRLAERIIKRCGFVCGGARDRPTCRPAAPVEARESVSSSLAGPESSPQSTPNPAADALSSRVAGDLPPAPPGVVTAVIPVRVFPIDAPKTGGLAGIKAGPITLAPYGFIKATVVHDSSDPDGDDFPFPGIWLNAGNNSTFNTGPTKDPEFHVKARSTRFGLNLEWPDISKNLTLTGKIEGDFEGNFSEVDNRDISSIRSLNRNSFGICPHGLPRQRRLDIFFVGGQDWTLFGSGALENIVETTFNGAFWGNIYTRSPQLRGGFIETLDKGHMSSSKCNLES